MLTLDTHYALELCFAWVLLCVYGMLLTKRAGRHMLWLIFVQAHRAVYLIVVAGTCMAGQALSA